MYLKRKLDNKDMIDGIKIKKIDTINIYHKNT